MTVRTMFSLALVLAVSSCVAACSKDGGDNTRKQSGESQLHKKADERQTPSKSMQHTSSGLASALKNKTLAKYPHATIGAAFDGYTYFTRKEWNEVHTSNGKIYIDFIGWLDAASVDAAAAKEGVTGRALDVKFVIEPDGSFFVAMVSRIEKKSDGKSYDYPLEDSAALLAKIYANKEIKF